MSAARNSNSRLPVSIFILYDEKEKNSRWDGLPTELTTLLRNDDTFTLVSLHDLKPGDEKVEKRRKALEDAKIVLLLVTDAFLDSPELLKETATAINFRKLGRNIVVPVILTELDWSDQPFAAFVPIKPEWNALSSVDEAQQIYDALVDLVKTRIITADESPETTKETIPLQFPKSKLDFPSLWFYCFSLLFLVMLAGLVWFSFHPPAQSTQPAGSSSQFNFFLGSMVIGIAAMSVIQVARRLFRIRGAFHQSRVLEWLGDSATRQLYHEVGEGRIKDLLDLPSELLTGQLAAIAEKVIELRARNESSSPLIEKMAGMAEQSETTSSKDAVDREVNLMLAIQRNLDQFQISTSAYWRRYLLLSSVLLSMGIFVIGLFPLQTGSFISGLSDPNELDHLNLSKLTGNFALLFLATLLSGLCAGFLGSIARDLVAIIEKLRR